MDTIHDTIMNADADFRKGRLGPVEYIRILTNAGMDVRTAQIRAEQAERWRLVPETKGSDLDHGWAAVLATVKDTEYWGR